MDQTRKPGADSGLASPLQDLEHQSPLRDTKRAGVELYAAPRLSLFDLVRPNENAFSRIIADRLDPVGTHGQGCLFLNALLGSLNLPRVGVRDVVQVAGKIQTDDRRRIDIIVETPTVLLGIETTLWGAVQQPNQLSDYRRELKNQAHGKRFALVFLSDQAEKSDPGEVVRLPPYAVQPQPSLNGVLSSVVGTVRAPRARTYVEDLITSINLQFGGAPGIEQSDGPYIEAVEAEFARRAARSIIVRWVSDRVRRTAAPVSTNVHRKPPLTARRVVHDCAPIHLWTTPAAPLWRCDVARPRRQFDTTGSGPGRDSRKALHRRRVLRCGEQLRPVIWRIALRQPTSKHRVGIARGAGLAQGVTVIDPAINHDPRRRIGSEKQPEPIGAEPGPEPMPVRCAECVALPELGRQRVARHAVEHEIAQCRQQPDVGVALPAGRIRLPGVFSRGGQLVELIEQQRVAGQPPAVSLQHGRTTAPPHPRSARRDRLPRPRSLPSCARPVPA